MKQTVIKFLSLQNCYNIRPNRFMMKLTNLVFVILLAFIISSNAKLKIVNGQYYDQNNRQFTFRGPSVVVKVPPYIPSRKQFNYQNSFSQKDMQDCRKWGLNGIRLGMMWAGVQPQKDTYNQTYLQQMLDLVNLAGSKYGIYSLIDFHQDLIAQKYCGDGVPTWLIDQIHGYHNFPWPVAKKIPLNSSGLPGWQKCDHNKWGLYYFSQDVGRTFHQLYKSGTKLNKKFQAYWQKVASVFKDSPYVIGYELINEPFVGKAVANPLMLLPSVAQRVHLQNFYDRLSEAIRKVDKQTPICFEPITFDNGYRGGFTHPPGGKRYQNLSAYAYHFYHPPDINLEKTIKARINDGKRLGIPSFLSQFYVGSTQIIQFVTKYKQSWMFWGYKDFGKDWGSAVNSNQLLGGGIYDIDGNPNKQVVSNFSQTFLPRVAGQLIQSSYNITSKEYTAKYEANPNGKTILYYNYEYNYPKGYILNVYPSQETSWVQYEPGYISISYKSDAKKIVSVHFSKI